MSTQRELPDIPTALARILPRHLNDLLDAISNMPGQITEDDLMAVERMIKFYTSGHGADQNIIQQMHTKLGELYELVCPVEPPVPVGYRLERQHKQTVEKHAWSVVHAWSADQFAEALNAYRGTNHAAYHFRLSAMLEV